MSDRGSTNEAVALAMGGAANRAFGAWRPKPELVETVAAGVANCVMRVVVRGTPMPLVPGSAPERSAFLRAAFTILGAAAFVCLSFPGTDV